MLRLYPRATFLVYVDSPERATSLEVLLKSCFQRCLSMDSTMTISARSMLVKTVREGYVRILITTDLEEDSLEMGVVDFIIHYDFIFPSLSLFKRRSLTQFGVPTRKVFIYYPLRFSNSTSSSVQFEDPYKRVSKIIKIQNRLMGNFIGKHGQTLKYFGVDAGVKFEIAEPSGTSRSVEIMGTSFGINKALILITKVLAKAEFGYDKRSKFQGGNGGGLVNSTVLNFLSEKMSQISAVKDVAPTSLPSKLYLEKMSQIFEIFDANEHALPSKARVVGSPAIPSFRKTMNNDDAEGKAGSGYVKVTMDRAPYLRNVDLKIYSNYMELTSALEKMFSCFTIGQCSSHGVPGREGLSESQSKDLLHCSEYVLTYIDKDSDWRLVGDVPWDLFTDSCRRLRIMKGSDAIGLGL